MICAVDTNIILDVFANDPSFADSSQQMLTDAYDSGSLIICGIVYAELVPHFDTRELLDSALSVLGIRVIECGTDVAWLAGRKWAEYKASGGARQRLLADFLIGAHALLRAECLLSRDRGFYKSYFPELKLMGPE